MTNENIKETPWDTKVFQIFTAEITEYSEPLLMQLGTRPGLYTIKVDPLADKRLLEKYGFYYCDTLIKPVCTPQQLHSFIDNNLEITLDVIPEELLKICRTAFSHGRFHRDPNIDNSLANQRYANWLSELINSNQVYALLYKSKTAGFIAVEGNELVLHAIDEKFRGKGLAKYWWSLVCKAVFANGHDAAYSSVSATNLPVMNLYTRLGFKFSQATDIYHKYVE